LSQRRGVSDIERWFAIYARLYQARPHPFCNSRSGLGGGRPNHGRNFG
jgi:hypothetical protein